MNRTPSAQQALQRLPKKWAFAIVVALILYVLVQPFANRRWGWNLPSLGGAASTEKANAEKPLTKPAAQSSANSNVVADADLKVASKKVVESKATEQKSSGDTKGDSSGDAERSATVADRSDPGSKKAGSTSGTGANAEVGATASKSTGAKTETPKSDSSKASPPKTSTSKSTTSDATTNAAASNLLYGLLKDAGREVYISPAGLRYTRGSEEGHRLKHVEKHLKDIPDRPGKHGVFDGDMAQVLRWIDDAFTRGKQGAKGVRKREEDGRTVYEVPFTKPIGYIGGRDGKRDNNPDAKRLRLVVDGDQVITAFPF